MRPDDPTTPISLGDADTEGGRSTERCQTRQAAGWNLEETNA